MSYKSGLAFQLDHARWLMDTDIRLSEGHNSRASVIIGFTGIEIAAIASLLGVNISRSGKVNGFQMISPHHFFSFIAFLLLAMCLGFVYFFSLQSFKLPPLRLPFPQGPSQLVMLRDQNSDTYVLEKLLQDTLECIYPEVNLKDPRPELDEEEEEWILLFAKHGPSLWHQNLLRRKYLNRAVIALTLTQVSLISFIILLHIGR